LRTHPPDDIELGRFDQLSPYYWHQLWEVFPGIVTPGRSVVMTLLDNAGVPKDLTGRRVIDIGAWNGCVSFECERRGADEVLAVSLEDPEWSGFNYLKHILEAKRTRFERGSIYDLDPTRYGTTC
jgi:tRNA (mo5U34)-methyltransferase